MEKEEEEEEHEPPQTTTATALRGFYSSRPPRPIFCCSAFSFVTSRWYNMKLVPLVSLFRYEIDFVLPIFTLPSRGGRRLFQCSVHHADVDSLNPWWTDNPEYKNKLAGLS